MQAEIKKLWKLDDPVWVENRKDAWRFIQRNTYTKVPKEDLKEYREYFLQANDKPYIPYNILYSLTPIETQSDSDLVFYSDMFNDSKRSDLLKFYLSTTTENIGCDWGRQQVHKFIQHRLNGLQNDVIFMDEVHYSSQKFVESSFHFMGRVLTKESDYSFIIDTFEYFLESLDKVDLKIATEKFNCSDFNSLLNQVYEVAEKCLSDSSFNPLALAYIQKLIESKPVLYAKADKLAKN